MSLSFNLALVGHLRVQPGMEAPQVPGVMVNENKLSLLYIYIYITYWYNICAKYDICSRQCAWFFIILPCRGCLWIWNCRRPSTILFNGVCWRPFFIQFRQRMWSLLPGASPYVSLEKYRFTWIKFGSKPAWSHLF